MVYDEGNIKPFLPVYEFHLMRVVLDDRQALAITTSFLPKYRIPSEFVALCRLSISFDEAINMIIMKESSRIINDLAYHQRSLLRKERKRPFARHTRGPLRGVMDGVRVDFEDRYEMAVKVVEKLGIPDELKQKKRGRKKVYSPELLLAAIIAKGDLSFSDLSKKLKEKGYGTPSKSTLFNAFRALPEEYLNEALKAVDEMVSGLYERFNENLNEFAGDNSAITCDNLVEREYKMKEMLMRDRSEYFALVRIPTNTILFVSEHTNVIDEIAGIIPEGSSLLMDAEYDVDENYFLAREHRIQLTVKPRKVQPNSAIRREFINSFDKKKYGNRKLAERPFGNITKRRSVLYYRSKESRLKGIMILALKHDIIEYYRSKRWTGLFF